MTLISTCSGVTLEIENCANAQGVAPNSTTKSNNVLNRLMSVWFEPHAKLIILRTCPKKYADLLCVKFMVWILHLIIKKRLENRFAKGVVVLCGSYDQCWCRKVACCVQI